MVSLILVIIVYYIYINICTHIGCGGLLTRNSGTIQSPNYPKPYPPSTKCEWQIEVDFGYSIEIRFTEIDVEKDLCDYDWVKVNIKYTVFDSPNKTLFSDL